MRAIVPIADINRRAPEAGRIRIGERTARAMKAIDTFRFTSPHREAIDAIAGMYGGNAVPWNEPSARIKNQFEVKTTSNKIEVLLPQGGLSTWYEMWSGGGCQRRCDGVTAEVPMSGPDGAELQSVPCICDRKQVADCKPFTRLNVVLPGVDFYGTWRLETKGWNAAQELPGMYDMIAELTSNGRMIKAFLHLEPRTTVSNGKTKNFVVPTLSVGATPEQMLAGGGSATPQLAAGTNQRELEQPSSGVTSSDVAGDHIIVDAEIVDEDEERRVEELARNMAVRAQLDADTFVEAIWADTDGDLAKIEQACKRAIDGKIVPILTDGKLSWEVS